MTVERRDWNRVPTVCVYDSVGFQPSIILIGLPVFHGNSDQRELASILCFCCVLSFYLLNSANCVIFRLQFYNHKVCSRTYYIMSAATPTIIALIVPVPANNAGFYFRPTSPFSGSAPNLPSSGAIVGLGATQLSTNQLEGKGSVSPSGRRVISSQGQNISQHLPFVDFITLGLTNVLHPDILHPIDDFIANNILPGASTKDTISCSSFLLH